MTQAKAFFTLIFAAFFTRAGAFACRNVAGLLIAAAGLAVIGMRAAKPMTLAGFLLTLVRRGFVGARQLIVTKKVGKVDLVAPRGVGQS